MFLFSILSLIHFLTAANITEAAAWDPVGTIFGVLIAIISFFLVRFYQQVQVLQTIANDLKADNKIILYRLDEQTKEIEILTRKLDRLK